MISLSNVFNGYLSHLEKSLAYLCRTETPFCFRDHLFYKDFVLDSRLNVENVINKSSFLLRCLISDPRNITEWFYKLTLWVLIIETLELCSFQSCYSHGSEHFLEDRLPVFVLWSDEIKLLRAAFLEQIVELSSLLLWLRRVMTVKQAHYHQGCIVDSFTIIRWKVLDEKLTEFAARIP